MKYFFSYFFLKEMGNMSILSGGCELYEKKNIAQAIANKILDTIEIQSDEDIAEVQHQLELVTKDCVEGSLRIFIYRVV